MMIHCVIPQSRIRLAPRCAPRPRHSYAQPTSSTENGFQSKTPKRFVRPLTPNSIARLRRHRQKCTEPIAKAKTSESIAEPLTDRSGQSGDRQEGETTKSSSQTKPPRHNSIYGLYHKAFPSITERSLKRVIRHETSKLKRTLIKHLLISANINEDADKIDHWETEIQSLRTECHAAILTRLSAIEFERNWVHQALPIESAICDLNEIWQSRLKKALQHSARDLPSSRARNPTECSHVRELWNSQSDLSSLVNAASVPVVYTLTDLKKRVMELDNEMPVYLATASPSQFWLHAAFQIPNWQELLDIYAELSPTYENYPPDYFDHDYPSRIELWEKRIKSALCRCDLVALRQLCRIGCNHDDRQAVWQSLLTDKGQKRYSTWEDLTADIARRHLWSDALVSHGVTELPGNCDQFFNFLPLIQQVMLAFNRDVSLQESASMKEEDPNATEQDDGFQRSNVVPYHEMSMLAAPLAYVCKEPQCAYDIFRRLYTRYWKHLTWFSTHPQGILSLYALFENIMHSRDPALWRHLRMELYVHPAEWVVPWMTVAFASFLEIDQVLLLWDRIIGYNDLRLLSILSAGIFLLRSGMLMKATTHREVNSMLSDIFHIEIVPVLQFTLFL